MTLVGTAVIAGGERLITEITIHYRKVRGVGAEPEQSVVTLTSP